MYESMHVHMPEAGGLQRVLARALPPASEVFRGVGSSDPASWALGALGVTANAVSAVTQTLVVIVLSVYWAAADRAERRVGTRLWTALGLASVRTPWTRLLVHIGDHARVEIARIASYVVLLGLGYRLLGLKFWVLPAIAAAVLALIPFLGALLAILVAALAAIERGPLLCALAIAFTALVVLFVEAAIRRALRVKHTHPILLALIVLALASSAGLVSVLLAPPLAAAIEWLAAFLIDHNGRTELDATVERVDARLQSLRARATHAETGASASMAPLIERAARVTERVRRLAP
jgi:predicted PurR-regulated permease PerM